MPTVDTHAYAQPPTATIALRQQVSIGLTLLVGAAAGATIARDELRPPAPPPVLATIDPNVAPWWELAALPGLGEVRSRAIVDHRDADGRTFRTAADLDDVHGIGPATVQRMAAYLHFDPAGAGPRPGPR